MFCEVRRIKKTRKEHTCEGCLGKISIGSPAFRYAGMVLDEGDQFGSFYLCEKCHLIYKEMPTEDKIFGPGDLKEG